MSECPPLGSFLINIDAQKATEDQLAYIVNTSDFQSLCMKLPRAEIKPFVELSPECDPDGAVINVVLTRLLNPVCSKCVCRDKTKLRACSRCQMTFYCNEACQTSHWPVHSTWCCKPNGPADTGPMRMAIVKMN
jgi:hypothetical protein